MAITFFGSASTPADNGTNTASPTSVTPPGSMVEGDLVLLIAHERAGSASITVNTTGGQSWTALSSIGASSLTARMFWCRFNGTWAADPSVNFSTGVCNTLVMLVYRPTTGSNVWAVDQALVELDFVAPSSPFTVTITGQTTTQPSTVTVAGWFTADDNTWGSLSGSGWAVAGAAQYRNTSGSDQSCTFADKIQTSAGATGNVSKNQATLGGDAGTSLIVTFYEEAPTPPPANSLALMGMGI